jgi:uncharacterized membrane protein HdeD (DUF308 family)
MLEQDTIQQPHTVTGEDVRDALHRGRGLLWFEGFMLLFVGVLAIVFPVATSFAIETVLGVIALVAGGIMLVRACTSGVEHRGGAVVSGVLMVALGGVLLAWPMDGLEAIVLLIAAFCLIRGISDLAGVPARSKVAPGLQMISGIAGIVLAILLVAWYPGDVAWVPGTLFGIELLFLSMPVLAIANAVSIAPARPVDD